MSLSTPQQNPVSSSISSPVDFVIITPLKEERDAVLNKLPGNKRLPPSDQDKRIYYAAQLPVNFSDDSAGVYQIIVMALIKMGRVEASMAAADAIRRWQPRYIILTGIAGGVARNEVKLGDIVISDQIVDYESQKLRHEEDPEMRWKVHQVDHGLVLAAGSLADDQWRDLVSVERPQEDLSNCHIGPIASGDKVISTEEFLNNLLYYWPKLIGVEMEAGGVVLAASQAARSPGFFMVRSVSDLGDKKKSSRQVKKWRSYACDVAASYTIALLQSGPITATKTWRRDTLSVDISEKLLPPNAPRAFLTMYCKDETRRYPLEKKLTRMGRDKRCELEILEICDNVDYFHATILYQEGHFIIIDGNKSNPSRFGTFVNGHKVLLDHPVQLKPQDRIVLGGFRTPAIGELARGACEIIFE